MKRINLLFKHNRQQYCFVDMHSCGSDAISNTILRTCRREQGDNAHVFAVFMCKGNDETSIHFA